MSAFSIKLESSARGDTIQHILALTWQTLIIGTRDGTYFGTDDLDKGGH